MTPTNRLRKTQIVHAPVVSPICAGQAIPDDYNDWAITGFRDVRVPKSLGSTPRIIVAPVDGDSLLPQHIRHGDLLVCRITDKYEDGKIGLWQTPNGRTAKYAFYDFDNCVVLHNEHGWQQRWNAEEIKLLGIVIKVERDDP